MSRVHLRVERTGVVYVKHGESFGIQFDSMPPWLLNAMRNGHVVEDGSNRALALALETLLKSLGHDVTVEVLT